MYKLVKWAYELGIRHERRRVHLLIAEHHAEEVSQQNQFRPPNEEMSKQQQHQRELHWAVDAELQNLIYPQYHEQVTTNLLDD